MLDREDYLKVIYDSPTPCMWATFIKNKNEKSCDVEVIGTNKVLDNTAQKEILKNHKYKINSGKYSDLFFKIDKLNEIKELSIVDFVDILGSFYQIDIRHISDDKYIVWFSKKIELDENIKLLLNKIGTAIWCKDKYGRYVYLNKSLDLYPNATPNKIVGKTDFEVFPEQEANVFVKGDEKLLAGELESMESLTFFNGNCYCGLNHVIKNDQDDIVGTIGMCIDTLRRKNLINEEISDTKMLELISDTIPDSIFFKDNSGIFRHCNKVFAQSMNLRKEEILGKSEEQINKSKSKIKKYKKEEEQIRLLKQTIISNHSQKCRDGSTKYFETVKVPFLDEHEMVGGVLGISRDISHRKEAELEFERLRMEFFANLSHEFKTPLNLIFSSIQLIESMIDRGYDSSKYITYTNIIKQNGYRILKMVNNLIDSTRLNSGCLELNKQNYNIVEFIENICESVQNYANEENISVIFDTNLEEKIMAFDLEKVERIMLNMLSNAIKYTKEKGKIEVSLNFEEEYLYIKVKDNGVGIPKDKLDDVFKLFKQINNRMTKLSEGSGIGLSIVKSLVDLHDGTINVYSKKGRGSEFIIKLPISLCDEKECSRKIPKYNKYVENIDIEFSDIYTSTK